jgi:hypothetical protein
MVADSVHPKAARNFAANLEMSRQFLDPLDLMSKLYKMSRFIETVEFFCHSFVGKS